MLELSLSVAGLLRGDDDAQPLSIIQKQCLGVEK